MNIQPTLVRVALLSLAAGFLILSGCGLKPVQSSDPRLTASPGSALETARVHRAKGDWAAATGILADAAHKFPEDARLANALADLSNAWAQEKRTRMDRILLLDSRAQIAQIDLWKSIEEDDPQDLGVRVRVLAEQGSLRYKGRELAACGDFHHKHNLRLARECLLLAEQILDDPQVSEQTAAVEKAYQAQLQRWRERKAAKVAKEHWRQVKEQLRMAQQLLHKGNGRAAREELEDILASEPDNQSANELMYQARSSLSQQVEALLTLGDSFYREDHLVAAISTWETVLRLSPGNKPASDKLGRAKKVQARLEKLRARQRAAESVAE